MMKNIIYTISHAHKQIWHPTARFSVALAPGSDPHLKGHCRDLAR